MVLQEVFESKNDSKDARRGDATPRKPPRRFLEERSGDRGPNAPTVHVDGVEGRVPEDARRRRFGPSERATHEFGRAGDFEASYAGVISGQITRREVVAQS